MTEYDNTNTGLLFKNGQKENEKFADYQGSINIDGVDFWLNAWIKTSSKTGKKFMSLQAKHKEQMKLMPARQDDDECPF
tara:strand:- start:37 stop:273 length:237 start_codon:yes stop_codon:yes gene_type:complete